MFTQGFIVGYLAIWLPQVFAQPWDLIEKQYVDYNYLEVGFVEVDASITQSTYTKITTSSLGITGKAVVFISIPDVAHILSSPNFPQNRGIDDIPPIVPKVKEELVQNEDGTFSFEFKLVTVNDSFCSTEWYQPIPIPRGSLTLEVSWLVAREGVYSLRTNYTEERANSNLVIQSGEITRASSAPQATNSNGNAIQYLYPFGCVSPDQLCTVNAVTDVPGISPGSGAIQQLQTSRNMVDGGTKDFFLTVRAWQVKKRSIWLVLVPHDSVDPAYFEITTPEIVAFLVFPTNTQVVCEEGFSFESITFTNVTQNPIALKYQFEYRYVPGVFGMLGSVVSMVDSTSLSVFERTETSAVFITKEDQCVSEQTIHITPEVVHVLVFGETLAKDDPIICGTKFTPPENVSTCFEFLISH